MTAGCAGADEIVTVGLAGGMQSTLEAATRGAAEEARVFGAGPSANMRQVTSLVTRSQHLFTYHSIRMN
jgi:hypothetical protein